MIKKKEIWFYLGITILLVQIIGNCTTLYSLSSSQQIIMQIMATLFLGIRIILEGFTLKEGILKISILLICFINYRICNESSIFITAIVIMAAKNMDTNKIVKFIAIFMSIFFGVLILIYIIEYMFNSGNLNFIVRITETGELIRHCFYYIHPNVFSEHITWTLFMWLYLKKEKNNYLDYLMIVLMALFIYFFPNSRTNAIILLLFIAVDKLYNTYNGKIIKFFQKNIFNICFIISFILLFLCKYDNFIINKINSIFNGRIKSGWYTNELFGMTLFGQELPIGTNIKLSQYDWIMGYALDNFYYRIFFSNGLLITIAYIIFINKRVKVLVDMQNTKELIYFTILCIFGLSEIVLMNIFIAFPLFTINKYYNLKCKETG